LLLACVKPGLGSYVHGDHFFTTLAAFAQGVQVDGSWFM
jgi:hypothetical protein